MKTFKKALSVILCLCMIMSVMAAGLNAFAQEEATAALDGAVSEAAALAVSDPTDENPTLTLWSAPMLSIPSALPRRLSTGLSAELKIFFSLF